MSTSDATLLPPLKASPHPSEHTRLLLALSATAIVFGGAGVLLVRGAGWAALAGLVLVLLAFAGLVWVGLQIYRARLLGNCIRVTRESAPELCAALEDVRTRLDYHRRVDVCIVDKANPPAQLTSYLGTKVIVFEGSLVADLLRGEDRSQLTFLIARYIGALKERHQRFTLVFVLLEAVSALKFLFPFIYPYYRATTYSGDQLAQQCCGDLDAALSATERLLVGKEFEPELRARGVIEQAGLVRGRVLPLLAQLAQHEPHLTNRYLNLLFFARRSQPESWDEFCRSADQDTNRELSRLWQRSPHRRSPSRARRVAASAAVAVVTGLILVGIGLVTLPSAEDETAYASTGYVTTDTVPTPEPTAVPTPEPIAVPTPASVAGGGSKVDELTAHVPASFRDTCDRTSRGAAVAAVDCTPLANRSPGTVHYYQFDDLATMNAQFDGYADELVVRDCPSGDATWDTDTAGGRVACYTDSIGMNYVAWTDETTQILGYAETILIGPQQLHRWWLRDSGPV